MSLKKLSKFQYFDCKGFFKGKRFMSVGLRKSDEGTKLEVVIVQDETDYGDCGGEIINNNYEKIVFKVPKKIDVPMNVEVIPLNPRATVYGDYRNLLSITVDDVEVARK